MLVEHPSQQLWDSRWPLWGPWLSPRPEVRCPAAGLFARGSFPTVQPRSHGRHIGPSWDSVQVKHGPAPAVNGQCDAKNADDVHDNSCSGLGDKKTNRKHMLVNDNPV